MRGSWRIMGLHLNKNHVLVGCWFFFISPILTLNIPTRSVLFPGIDISMDLFIITTVISSTLMYYDSRMSQRLKTSIGLRIQTRKFIKKKKPVLMKEYGEGVVACDIKQIRGNPRPIAYQGMGFIAFNKDAEIRDVSFVRKFTKRELPDIEFYDLDDIDFKAMLKEEPKDIKELTMVMLH